MDGFHRNGHKLCICLFLKACKFKTSMARVPYNKLLTYLASSSHTGKYWLSVVFAWTLLRLVRIATVTLYHVTVIALFAFDCYLIQRSQMNSCLAYAINSIQHGRFVSFAHSKTPQPRANIPLYGSYTWLVRG